MSGPGCAVMCNLINTHTHNAAQCLKTISLVTTYNVDARELESDKECSRVSFCFFGGLWIWALRNAILSMRNEAFGAIFETHLLLTPTSLKSVHMEGYRKTRRFVFVGLINADNSDLSWIPGGRIFETAAHTQWTSHDRLAPPRKSWRSSGRASIAPTSVKRPFLLLLVLVTTI